MAIQRLERKLLKISPQLLTADGTSNGVVKVADSCLFRHRQDIILRANLINPVELEVKEISDETTILVGPRSYSLKDRIDISAFATALSATIEAPRQAIKAIDEKEIGLTAFERAPVSGYRIIPVDRCGNINDPDHPIFVEGTVTLGNHGTPTIFSKSIADKDTEESQALPAFTKKFQFKIRKGDSLIKFAFAAGEIAAGRFWTVWGGDTETQNHLNMTSGILYFETSKDNVIIEILAWTT